MKILTILAFALAGVSALTGAIAEELWSLEPVGNPTPTRLNKPWERNAIDAFIAASLDRKEPEPQADRRALIRRATFDLTGLPPEPRAVEAFVADNRSDALAFADVVERLLDSKHYGEHWGRHWLDVVRYADTAGENSDHPLPHAWRYRNWVIDAFNDDKPYDTFVKEQLAGDLLSPDSTVATGYLAIARRFGHDIDKSMHLTYEDAIDNLGKAFLGLTISCARCHDHKHDPITTRDYYALYGVLQSTRFSFPGCEPQQQPRDLVPIGSPDQKGKTTAWEKRRDELAAKVAPIAEQQSNKSKALKTIVEGASTQVSSGDVPDGGSVLVSREPISIEVRKGETILLSILPRGNYGADTTILDFTLSHGDTAWLMDDLIDNLTVGNPHPATQGATWCFLDTSGDPKLLAERRDSVDGKTALRDWSMGGSPPLVLVNTSTDPVKVWTTLPPRTFFVHPGPNGPVAVAWASPVDGKISIDLKISDGHPGGDGVAWRLEHLASTEIASALKELGTLGARHREHEAAIKAHAANQPTAQLAYAVSEGEPQAAKIQLRGDPEDLGEVVPREFLSALGGGALGDEFSSGRLELAEHIASPDNPLTARVMVNRIWAWHFGRGLVATPNDFGVHGVPPTHPQLLDFLARRFIESGWSVKALHRLIMESATYQRAAGDAAAAARYAAFSRRKVTAEELRDSLLVASGELDRTPGRTHPFPAEETWKFTQHAPFAAEYPTKKRSVYMMRKRNRTSRFFALFNGADPNASTARRDLTTAPTQALFFMNDPFFHGCAAKFAGRVRDRSQDSHTRLDFAYRELFARPPTQREIEAFEEFVRAMAGALPGSAEEKDIEIWNSYARVLLGSNELLHVD